MAKNRDSISNEDVSILSSGVKIEGKLYSEGNVRIDGKNQRKCYCKWQSDFRRKF